MNTYLSDEEKTLQTISNETDIRLQALTELQTQMQEMQADLDSFIESV